MLKRIAFFVIMLLFLGCQSEQYKDVGDIPFDVDKDDSSFLICNESNIKQYYVRYSSDIPPNYEGEKRGMEKEILGQYQSLEMAEQNGYITIRFIVNCKGASGRFRIEEMDFNLMPYKFDASISKQLMQIVKGLKGWIPRKRGDTAYDYYQHLVFKIENGQISKILP
ncbi:MAG: hypothetical protein P1U56_18700 [Saprospiraceae bacterium]|nr:hypothetical protein [Saprospiraceae bacterium]